MYSKKIVVAISGASGVQLGIKFLTLIPNDIEVYAIISSSAKHTLSLEIDNNYKIPSNKPNITILNDSDLGACVSSGSFQTDALIIVPCSMNTLAKCCVGISDTLITRVFGVMLKERRDIIIAPREMPYNTIQLENMAKLSSLGISIAPPALGYYSNQQTLDEMENFIIGKWFDLLNIQHNLFKRWGE
ncbi:MAG: UbiX family flavin prenyltransferase [Campylobacterota bacterium]|nr:UbiX family flavin prenyltransferase [Campylobacterota bacterium]